MKILKKIPLFLAITITITITTFIGSLFLNFIPDYCKLYQSSSVVQYLLTIISSIASISGLLIAVLIVVVEYFRLKLGPYFLTFILKDRYVLQLIGGYVFVFLITGISLLIIPSNGPQNPVQLTLSYYSIIFFLFLFPITFVLIYYILRNLSLDRISKKTLLELDFLIDGFSGNLVLTGQMETNQIDRYGILSDNSRVLLLSNIAKDYYIDNQFIKGQSIINKVSDKFHQYWTSESRIKDGEMAVARASTLFDFYISIVSSINNKGQSLYALKVICKNLEEIYKKLILEHYPLSDLKYIKIRVLDRLLNFFEDQIGKRKQVIICINAIIIDLLRNRNLGDGFKKVQQKNDNIYTHISTLEIATDNTLVLDWVAIQNDYLTLIAEEANWAIVNKEDSYFETCLVLLQEAVFFSDWKEGVFLRDLLVQQWQFNNVNNLIKPLIYEAVSSKIGISVTSSFLFKKEYLFKAFENKWYISLDHLSSYLDFITFLLNRDELQSYHICEKSYEVSIVNSIQDYSLEEIFVYLIERFHDSTFYSEGVFKILDCLTLHHVELQKTLFNNNKNQLLEIVKFGRKAYLLSRSKNRSQRLLRRLKKLKIEMN